MDSVNNHPGLIDTSDYPHSSSISEVDSLSDSDWLDITSGRESDDNNSVSSNSHCDEGDGLLHSRRSSISAGSSQDGDVEAWEGFVDDSADEAVPVDQIDLDVSPIQFIAAHVAEPTAIVAQDRDIVEEQRVKDALDQSMISTLSASRSSSLGAPANRSQGSPRDLRLSFPDPLTSSRDELNGPYENPSPSESTFSLSDGDHAIVPDDLRAPQIVDTGSFTTPAVPQSECTIDHFTPSPCCYLDIVLYGSSPAIKWDFIDAIVEKVAIGGGGHAIILSHKISVGYTRLLRVEGMRQREGFTSLVVSVTDRTEGSTSQPDDSSTKCSVDRPSLAVVFLPSDYTLPSSAEHDYYLPVFVRSSTAMDPFCPEDATLLAAHHVWDMLAIPIDKTLQLREIGQSRILDSEDLDQVQPSHAHHVFELISAPEVKKPAPRFADQFTSFHSVTTLALLSLILGLIVNSAFRTSAIVPTVVAPPPNQSWSLLCPVINHTAANSPSVVNSDVAIVPSSLKDFALAVFNPTAAASPKPLIIPSAPGRAPSSPKSTDCDKQIAEAARRSRDSILLPGSIPPPEPCTDPSPTTGKASSHAETSPSSLSLRIADSLSVFFDVKTVFQVVCSDLKELIDALEELVAVINRQTTLVMKRSIETAENLGDVLLYRNSRARGRAKEFKDMAEDVIAFAGVQIKGRAETARAKARALKDYYLTSAPWGRPRNSYGKAAKADKPDKLKRKKRHGKHRAGKMFRAG